MYDLIDFKFMLISNILSSQVSKISDWYGQVDQHYVSFNSVVQ